MHLNLVHIIWLLFIEIIIAYLTHQTSRESIWKWLPFKKIQGKTFIYDIFDNFDFWNTKISTTFVCSLISFGKIYRIVKVYLWSVVKTIHTYIRMCNLKIKSITLGRHSKEPPAVGAFDELNTIDAKARELHLKTLIPKDWFIGKILF